MLKHGTYRDLVENGVKTIELDQQCGQYIDPDSLQEVGYIDIGGKPTQRFKGFTCPFGQVCQVLASLGLGVVHLPALKGNTRKS